MSNNIISNGVPKEFLEMLKLNFYDALEQKENNTYCSTTDLLKPVKFVQFKKRYASKVSRNAIDMVWMVFGSSVHNLLELALKDNPDYEIEERIYEEFEIDGEKYIVSGKFDIYDKVNKKLKDLKTTSVYSIISLNDGEKQEYVNQLNIYKYLLRNKYEINGLSILYFAKDWNKRKAQFDRNYLPSMIGEEDVEMYGNDFIEKFIKTKLSEIIKYDNVPDDEIPPCPLHERYQDPATLALYASTSLNKNGTIPKSKKATKLFNDIDELFEYIKSKEYVAFGIQYRPKGIPKRCFDFCEYNQYCNFYKKQLLVLGNNPNNQTIDFVEKSATDLECSKEMLVMSLYNISDEDKKYLGIV